MKPRHVLGPLALIGLVVGIYVALTHHDHVQSTGHGVFGDDMTFFKAVAGAILSGIVLLVLLLRRLFRSR